MADNLREDLRKYIGELEAKATKHDSEDSFRSPFASAAFFTEREDEEATYAWKLLAL